MFPPIRINVDATRVMAALKRAEQVLRDPQPVLEQHARQQAANVAAVFQGNARGGTTRGITWRSFALSSQPHPSRFGHARGGMTLGARRPSGRHVSPASRLLDDTGTLRRAATTVARDGRGVSLGARLPKYADAQARTRPWLRYGPEDGAQLAGLFAKALTGALFGRQA